MAELNGKKVLFSVHAHTSGAQDASQVNYDNTESGLEATNVQDAIDEVAEGSGGDYLPLSGGTMSGDIAMALGTKIVSNTNRIILQGTNDQTYLGNAYGNTFINVPKNSQLYVQKSGKGNYIILDTDNTQANPTLAGTEAELTGLQIAGTKYKVGGGGSAKYLHIISEKTSGYVYSGMIVTDSNVQFTSQTLAQFLYDNNYRESAHSYPAQGIYFDASQPRAVAGLYSEHGTSLTVDARYINNGLINTFGGGTIADVVMQV